MARFKRGRPITANALNQTVSEAETGANPIVVQGQVQVGPRGHHIHIPTKYVLPDGAMWAQYTSSQTAGQYNVVEIYDDFSTHTGEIILKVRKPEIPGNDTLAITHKGVGQNELVPVQVSGYSLVEYYREFGTALALRPDLRLGTIATSLFAHLVPLGPFRAVEPNDPSTRRIGNPVKQGQDDDDVSYPLRLITVEILDRRGDYQPMQTGGYPRNTYQVIYLDSNYNVSPLGRNAVRIHKK